MNYKPLLFIFIILTLILCSSSANATTNLTTINNTIILTEDWNYANNTDLNDATNSTYYEEVVDLFIESEKLKTGTSYGRFLLTNDTGIDAFAHNVTAQWQITSGSNTAFYFNVQDPSEIYSSGISGAYYKAEISVGLGAAYLYLPNGTNVGFFGKTFTTGDLIRVEATNISTEGVKIYQSTDNGTSWTKIADSIGYTDPTFPTYGYVGFGIKSVSGTVDNFTFSMPLYEGFEPVPVPEIPATVSYSSGTITISNGYTNTSHIYSELSNISIFDVVDADVTINANILIENSGKLTIDDYDYVMNCSSDMEYIVTNYGKLYISNSTYTTPNSLYHTKISNSNNGALYAWSFRAFDSDFSNMGSNNLSGTSIIMGVPGSYTGNGPIEDVYIVRCNFTNLEHGIFYMNTYEDELNHNFYIKDNNFTNVYSPLEGNAALLGLVENTIITGNVFDNVRSGIYTIFASGLTEDSGIIIGNNSFLNCANGATYAIGSKHSDNITITHNKIRDHEGGALIVYKGWVDDYEHGDNVQYNYIDNVSYSGGFPVAIQYWSETPTTFSNNVITNINGTGLRLLGVNDTIFENNTISSTESGLYFQSETYREVLMHNYNLSLDDTTVTSDADAVYLYSSVVDIDFTNSTLVGGYRQGANSYSGIWTNVVFDEHHTTLPLGDILSSTTDTPQTFNIDVTNCMDTANVTWFFNGTDLGTNLSVTSAAITYTPQEIGTFNMTASATDGSTNVTQTWTWTVTEVPVTPTEEPTTWNTMQDNTASKYTSIMGITVSCYILIGVMLAYGGYSNKIKVSNKTIKYYAGTGFVLFLLVIIGLLMLQWMDNIMGGVI